MTSSHLGNYTEPIPNLHLLEVLFMISWLLDVSVDPFCSVNHHHHIQENGYIVNMELPKMA